jgi:hypothetical protein
MDDELEKLEAELSALRPAAPSRAVHARVARDLTPPARSLAWWAWSAVPAAIAAALVLAFVATNRPATAGEAAPDEGLVTLADGTPARRVRSSYVDTITWKNPRNNASLRWSVPREEVRVVPVVFQ